uniref:Nucleoside-diphosphate-sugar epimerases n=1 Tax=uncultured verrucomicrobium HF0500_08N17 TaxID=723597 RepID=E7C4X9_9BACT|nr:nucleoside-diphosphate-sugar epimerases [uncultured verrucomicrobium HF0500_08N17]
MYEKCTVLITGINGFIGKALEAAMRGDGYEVWGIDIESDNDNQIIGANLLHVNEVYKASQKIPQCTVLIHTAALAHGQNPPFEESIVTTNVKITDNIIKVFCNKTKHIIFLSSVAVYGEENRNTEVTVSDCLRPSTEYGTSKQLCEELLIQSKIANLTILRLAPVYDNNHMVDIRKRVFFPGLPTIKMIIKPSPRYSLTSVETITKTVLNILSNKINTGEKKYNVVDSKPYKQNELINWFPGQAILLPVILTKPFYWLTYILPKKYGYKFRCFYSKIFKSNIYKINAI